MRFVHALAVLAFTALTGAAQGAPANSAAPVDATSSPALCRGGLGANCTSDATCGDDLVCNARCPVIPGRPNCKIAGGVCAPRCMATAKALSGKSFKSLDGTHAITFESPTTYRKTDGCPTTGGIHCDHIVLTTGTYRANGERIWLTPNQGARATLTVEPHCYDGLLDPSDNTQLYPAT